MFTKSVSGLQPIKATSIEVATRVTPININENGIQIPQLHSSGKIPIKFGDTDFHVGHLHGDPNNEYIYLNSLAINNTDKNVELSLETIIPAEGDDAIPIQPLSASIPGDLELSGGSIIKIGTSQIQSSDLSDGGSLL
jgi:hypothetical protein